MKISLQCYAKRHTAFKDYESKTSNAFTAFFFPSDPQPFFVNGVTIEGRLSVWLCVIFFLKFLLKVLLHRNLRMKCASTVRL